MNHIIIPLLLCLLSTVVKGASVQTGAEVNEHSHEVPVPHHNVYARQLHFASEHGIYTSGIHKPTSDERTVLVYGANGALGDALVQRLLSPNTYIVAVASRPQPFANSTLLIDHSQSATQQYHSLLHQIQSSSHPYLNNSTRFQSIFCVAGGWTLGSMEHDQVFQQVEEMYERNIQPALITSKLASRLLVSNGALVLIGSAKVYKEESSQETVAYTLAKSGLHTLARILPRSVGRVLLVMPGDLSQKEEPFKTSVHYLAEMLDHWVSHAWHSAQLLVESNESGRTTVKAL